MSRLHLLIHGRRPPPTVENLDERLEQVERIAAENLRARLLAEARLQRLEAGLHALERERDLLWAE